MNTIQISERLNAIISQIDKSITCQSVTDNGNGIYTFNCAYTKWATKGYNVTIGLNTYKITDVTCNQSITVKGTVLPTQLTFDLYAPKFKHGTIKKAAHELSLEIDYKNKLPLIFLHDVTNESIHFNEEESLGTEADCRLYFLTSNNIEDWTIAIGDTSGIQPMRSLVNEFLKVLSVSQYVNELNGIGTVTNHNVFGTFDDKGTIRNMFNEFLTGVQLRITIPFKKYCDCCEVPELDNRPAPAYVYDNLGNVLAVLYSNEYYITTGGTCLDVTIKDQDGNTLTTVASGGEYTVTVLDGIQDTLTSNVTTITDNII